MQGRAISHRSIDDHFLQRNDDLKVLNLKNGEKVHGTSIYCGQMLIHFGHQFAEDMHRLWAMADYKYDHLIFAKQMNREATKQIIRDAVLYLGGDLNKILFVDRHKPYNYDHLIIPDRGSQMEHKFEVTEAYLDKLSSMATTQPDPKLKVFVTRRHLKDLGYVAGESYIARELSKNGFIDFTPEGTSCSEQLNLYLNSKILIFSEGSAIHGTDLIGRLPDCEAGVIRRRASESTGFLLKSKVKTLRSIDCRVAKTHPQERRTLSFIDPEATIAWLQDFGVEVKLDMEKFVLDEGRDAVSYARNSKIGPGEILTIRDNIKSPKHRAELVGLISCRRNRTISKIEKNPSGK